MKLNIEKRFNQNKVLIVGLVILLVGSIFYINRNSMAIVTPTNLIYSWNYSSGTLDATKFASYATGSYSFQSGAVRVTSSAGEGSAPISYSFVANPQATIKLEITFSLETLPITQYTSTILARLTNAKLYGGTHSATFVLQCEGTTYSWRLYLSGASTSIVTASPQVGKQYVVDFLANMGSGTAEAAVILDGVQILSASGGTVNTAYDTVEYGISWTTETTQQTVDIYSMVVYGIPTIYRTISGTVYDSSTNQLLSSVSVSASGSSCVTLTDGAFAISVPAGTYNVKFIKPEYDVKYVYADVQNADSLNMIVKMAKSGTVYSNVSWQFRSACIFPYWFSYDSVAMDTCLSEMKSKFGDGFNTIDLRTYWTADPNNANNVMYTYGQAENENGKTVLKAGINKAHAVGFAVQLGVICSTDLGGTYPSPTDWNTWWDNYRIYQVQTATWAQSLGVEYYMMGWELVLADLRFENGVFGEQWIKTINAIRQVYGGKIAYEFNWVDGWRTTPSNLLANTWASNLDYIGISQYQPLSAAGNLDPTIPSMVLSWTNNPYDGYNYIEIYRQLSNQAGKKIVLNIGYYSADGSACTPWTHTSTMDLQEQADAYSAMFEALTNAEYVYGVDLEHFDKIYSEGISDVSATFRNKPAEPVIVRGIAMYLPKAGPVPITAEPWWMSIVRFFQWLIDSIRNLFGVG